MLEAKLARGPDGRLPWNRVLLRTKLFSRPSPSDIMPRPHLAEFLDQTLAARLTLVSAPAGFGKTTTISQWLAEFPGPAAWLSLDAADNDPMRFLDYVVAALRTALPDLGVAAQDLLDTMHPPPVESIVTALVNELSTLPADLLLVLDDYDIINDARVHHAVTFLLENLPPRVHLVIASRCDPPLPLARFRSRRHLVEVRADALRFGPEEVSVLLNRYRQLSLSPEQIAALHDRTEGWIAGLELAALAMRGSPDVSQFIQSFTGDHRYVVDFLVQEVLGRQPKPVRAFLLHTSILGRLSARLCEAVTGQKSGQAMLEKIEAENLFLVSLDDQRDWYRYHHLFSNALAGELRRSEPHLVPRLHIRASEWYERESLAGPALEHATAARDFDRVTRLVAQNWLQLYNSNEVVTLLNCLERVPEEVMRSNFNLSCSYVTTGTFLGKFRAIESHVHDVERMLAEQVSSGKVPSEYVGVAMFCSAWLALTRGDVDVAVGWAEKIVALAPEFDAMARTFLYVAVGYLYDRACEQTKAIAAYVAAIRLCRESGNYFGVNQAAGRLARIYLSRGQLRRAAETCRDAIAYAAERDTPLSPALGAVHLVLADVLREWNELEEAEGHVRQGIELARQGGHSKVVAAGALLTAKLKRAHNDLDAALAALSEHISDSADGFPPSEALVIPAFRARLWLDLGDLSSATRWADWTNSVTDRSAGYRHDTILTAVARVRNAEGKLTDSVELLDRALGEAQGGGRMASMVEMLVLRALVLEGRGDMEQALSELSRAIHLAQPEGYQRVFLDEGSRLASLMKQGLACGLWSSLPLREYVCGLIAQFDREVARPLRHPDGVRRRSSKVRVVHHLGESQPSLTDREMEVFRLLNQGCSNKEIAENLVITVHTAKRHTINIFRKLGANRRTQAILRGRELGFA